MIVLQNKKTGRLVKATFDGSKRHLKLDRDPFDISLAHAKKKFLLVDACSWEILEMRARGFVLERL